MIISTSIMILGLIICLSIIFKELILEVKELFTCIFNGRSSWRQELFFYGYVVFILGAIMTLVKLLEN